jgi:alkaline ceramidase
MLFTLLFIVGIGSVYFHGSLSIAGQVLDELPISLLCMFGCFMLRPKKKWHDSLRSFLFSDSFFICAIIGSTLISILYPVLSHVFVLSWLPLTIGSFFQEFNAASEKGKNAARGLFGITIMFFCLAFGCWLLDRLACEQVQAIFGFNPQLHAFWHVFISFTFWGCVCTGIIIRCSGDGIQVTPKPSGFVMPYIAVVV